jgi:methionyl-tRNA formyltransferase
MSIRVVFMGTPDFAVPTLEALLDVPDMEVAGVVTQPDRPAGRGKTLRQSPVKQLALKAGLPVFQPAKLRGEEVLTQLANWQPDFHVVAAYGQILRQNMLDLPTHGSINVHASLLPRWRGAAPIQAAILAGDTETGVTIMQMDAGLDTGPILKKSDPVRIQPDETGQSLHDKLAELGGPLLVETLRGVLSREIKPQIQDETQATYANRIDKSEGQIVWSESAEAIDRRVRAFTPWPGTFTYLDGDLLKIHAGKPLTGNPKGLKAGEISIEDSAASLVIGTGDGRYAPSRLQLAGRKAMDVDKFLNGMPDIHGKQLEEEIEM